VRLFRVGRQVQVGEKYLAAHRRLRSAPALLTFTISSLDEKISRVGRDPRAGREILVVAQPAPWPAPRSIRPHGHMHQFAADTAPATRSS